MRAFLVNMMTLPGKKLTFMGCEFAQFREWDFANQLEWFMLEYPRHTEMQRFVKRLNKLYLDSPELWEVDDSWAGFNWIYADSADMNMVAYRRYDTTGKYLISVINYAPVTREGFIIEVDAPGEYEVLLDSDAFEFGGRNALGVARIKTEIRPEDGREVLKFTLPAMSGVILRKTDRSAAPKKRGRPRKTDTVAKNTSEKPEKAKKTSTKRSSASKKTPKKSKA